jgi:uncharacterized protein
MNELRIDVADLLAHPGARRALRTEVTVDALGTAVATISGPVALDVVLERVPEGIVVRGTATAPYEAQCSTCLRPVVARLEVEVSELFEDFPVDGETYPIEGHQIDVEQLLRDSLVLELPLAPACPDGDPECVADPDAPFSDADDDAEDPAPATDPRWAALSQLEL